MNEWETKLPALNQVSNLLGQFLDTYNVYLNEEVKKIERMVELKNTIKGNPQDK